MNVKEHFKKNKAAYVAGAAGVVVGAGAVLLLKRGGIQVGSLAIKGDQNVTNIGGTVNHFTGTSRMSKIVSLDGTDRWFISQAEAARELGLSPTQIGLHLNRGDSLPGGISLTRRGVSS